MAIVLTSVLSWVSWGRGVGESLLPDDFAACPAGAEREPPPAGLTYYKDVKPILDARCAGCHVEGDPADEGAPLPTERQILERVDLTLRMAEPYSRVPTIGRDDVRCFLLDWPVDDQVFVTGLDVRPGNRTMVHHLSIFVAEASTAGELRARDAGADGPGWARR